MYETTVATTGASVICREMVEADGPAVVALLTVGFAPWRTRAFWQEAVARLVQRDVPAGLPQLGYVLEASGLVVGVLLVISSERGSTRRCNVSSWYVEPAHRLYAPLLVRQAIRLPGVTYTNVTPAPPTWPLLAVQGYRRYAAGRVVAIPALARRGRKARVVLAGPDLAPGPDLPADEVTLLRDHAQWDCLSLVCVGEGGRVPFVFGMRRRRIVVRFAYLLYCRDVASFVAHARPLGLFLARRGIGVVVADANAKLPGMPGWFQDGFPKFAKGPAPPVPSDLAYTERAVFGV